MTPEAVQYIDPTVVTLRNGEWYAFEVGGRQFYATVYNNGFTGLLELTEIPDPHICLVCGNSYGEGDHEHGLHKKHWRRGEHHEFKPRGAPPYEETRPR